MQSFLAAFTGLIANLTLRIEIRGAENIPKDGALIVAANHIGWVDPPLLRWVIGRHMRYMAKIELFKWTISGLAVRLFDAFPVRRGERDRIALRQALRLLKSGEVLGMFPEGTRSRNLRLARGHSGIALIALRSRAPILPVGIIGTNRMLKWPDMILRNRRVTFNIGEPFVLSRDDGSYEEMTRSVMLKVAALLPKDMRGYYADDHEQSHDGRLSGARVVTEAVTKS